MTKPCQRRPRRGQCGQALVEFTVMLSMMLSIVLVTFLFLAVFTEYGWRVLQLIGLEYP